MLFQNQLKETKMKQIDFITENEKNTERFLIADYYRSTNNDPGSQFGEYVDWYCLYDFLKMGYSSEKNSEIMKQIKIKLKNIAKYIENANIEYEDINLPKNTDLKLGWTTKNGKIYIVIFEFFHTLILVFNEQSNFAKEIYSLFKNGYFNNQITSCEKRINILELGCFRNYMYKV